MEERVKRLAEASLAPMMWATYQREWKHFCVFAEAEGVATLPALVDLVAQYVAWMAEVGREG